MPQTTQHFRSVSDSFHSRIDVWVFMMWPLWPSGSGHSGLCPPLPPPSGHKGHIIQPQTSILEWKLSLTEWKRWVVWGILTSKILQPKRTIRILPILSPNSETAKDPRMLFSSLLKGPLCFVKMFAKTLQIYISNGGHQSFPSPYFRVPIPILILARSEIRVRVRVRFFTGLNIETDSDSDSESRVERLGISSLRLHIPL